MREENVSNGWTLIGAAIVLLIAVTLTAHLVGWTENAAAWVQAVGSVLALALTGGLAVWEAHQRRVQEHRRDANRLLARVALLEHSLNMVARFAEAHLDRSEGESSTSVQRAVQYMAEAIAEIRFEEMPTPRAVRAFTSFRAGLVHLGEWIQANPGAWMSDRSLKQLTDRLDRMEETLDTIREEARLLAEEGAA